MNFVKGYNKKKKKKKVITTMSKISYRMNVCVIQSTACDLQGEMD